MLVAYANGQTKWIILLKGANVMNRENFTLNKPNAKTYTEYAAHPDRYLTIQGVPP